MTQDYVIFALALAFAAAGLCVRERDLKDAFLAASLIMVLSGLILILKGPP